MLKTAYNTPKSAKYKYILMALISMMQSSMCLSRWQVADYYFLEAEKLVRLRGLKQIKSRKARLLHHCYVFWCMLQESTYIGGLPGIHRRCVLQAIQSSELVVYSRDSLSFRLPKWTDLEKEIKDVKAQDIFAISEAWLFLLSLVIRLGKEKDAAEHNFHAPDALPLAGFLARAKTIERGILRLHQQRQADHFTAENEHEQSHSAGIILTLHCLMDAALHAIQISFYRRVYDLDVSLLQQNVQSVLDFLLSGLPVGQKTEPGQLEGAPRGTAWQASSGRRSSGGAKPKIRRCRRPTRRSFSGLLG